MNTKQFKELFDTHWKWQMGVFATDLIKEGGAILYFGKLRSEFFDVALPDVSTPEELNLGSIKKRFEDTDRTPSFYLTEEKQKSGFGEYLTKNGFSLLDSDTWMVLDTNLHKKEEPASEIVEVTPGNFKDYYSVLSVVFKDFKSNERYLEICKGSISGNVKADNFRDFKSELFLIYDNGKPAAGGAMFYSVKGNFAYLHDAGTLEEFRGKGYQTDLIRYRVNKALNFGIDRIYTLVEQGGQSWKNMTKNGFAQEQVASIFSIKNG